MIYEIQFQSLDFRMVWMSQNNENEELLNIFLEEATDLLNSLSSILQKWSKDIDNKAYSGELKRDLHTLKGGARMMNQSDLGALAHELESLCEGIVTDKVLHDRKTFDVIYAAVDRMTSMIDALSKKQPVPDTQELMIQLKQMMNAPETQKPVKPLPPAEPQKTEKKESDEILLKSEVTRVKSELLEKVNNLSMEDNVLRVKIRQQISIIGQELETLLVLTKKLQTQFIQDNKLIDEAGFVKCIEELVGTNKHLFQTNANVDALLLKQARVGVELQERMINTRMVNLESIVPRLARMTRQIAAELNKKVDLNVVQSEGEMDRGLLEHLIPPLEHLIRNSIDHGIENPETRISSNKSEVGQINIRFFRSGNSMDIEIQDDGAGIDVEKVKKKAIDLGLLTKDLPIEDKDAILYILEPGFSTREVITEISGRGVGMDVVNTTIKALGGSFSISSKKGLGTKIVIRMPFTVSVNRAIMVMANNKTYAILLSNIEVMLNLDSKKLQEAFQSNNPSIVHNGHPYQLKVLNTVLKIKEKMDLTKKKSFPVLIFNLPDVRVALLVERLIGSEEIVLQSLGPQFKLMESFAGALLQADGSIVVVLDVYSIATSQDKKTMDANQNKVLKNPQIKPARILVVDDSVTIRSVTQNFLEHHHYQVMTAKDGVDALKKLKTDIPDLILLDVEMPNMNGFELAEILKNDPNLNTIPIIMITFRSAEDYKKRAYNLGVKHFIAKPFEEADLLSVINELLSQKHE